jgi:hypothetical protein
MNIYAREHEDNYGQCSGERHCRASGMRARDRFGSLGITTSQSDPPADEPPDANGPDRGNLEKKRGCLR